MMNNLDDSVTTRPAAQIVQLPPSVETLRSMVAARGDPAATLDSMVRLIQGHFRTDVCSVYLLEPDRSHLVLAATRGLRPESVRKVRMSLHEGLAGLVAQQSRPVMAEEATRHARFKFFPEAGEEPYHSFLGLPLLDRGLLQGVMVLQTTEPRIFGNDEIQQLNGMALSLGPIVSEVRRIEQLIAPDFERLFGLSRNLWWCWDMMAEGLFRALNPRRWHELDHNPVALIAEIPLLDLEERVDRHVLSGGISHTCRRLHEYLDDRDTWGDTHAGVLGARPVAYFSAEFGLHESVPVYSGGLGILAGDHIKSASDLGVPLIGVGLYYSQGYFHQYLDQDGWQHEDYLDVDVWRLPVEPATGGDGQPLMIHIDTRNGTLSARVWKLSVGRCTLLLLDSDVEENNDEDRALTARLYGGDDRTRIRQELLLGVGGVRALTALGISPGVLHMNEGHSAFASLEIARTRMEQEAIGFRDAMRRVRRRHVFTTHTPVPAGHDRFSADLVEEHLGPLRDALGLNEQEFLGLGRTDPANQGESFCMTVLAMKMSRRTNGVSALHGRVSRSMWRDLWPDQTVPIGHITNGVHVLSWLAPQMRMLYERHLGPDWAKHSAEPRRWIAIDRLDDSELWEVHQILKSRLLDFVRRRVTRQEERREAPPALLEELGRSLSLDTLTIGFARRFAEYKRGHLLLSDLDALDRLVNNAQAPVQILFAGKAHPHDGIGKGILQQIDALSRDPRFAGKVVFVENYDMNTARHLVQGVDLWLNTPRRPLEASGTSGQKVVLNGGLNLSVLDGWWAEAWDGRNGFTVGNGSTHSDQGIQDARDAAALFRVLREEVVP
ncbi:MAG: alpha-glucan family phosphorylase, partial [Thiohalobacterales bacterium]|nr:alpha-glucan family phosphorylase [Thiohalobacterales bacterium]